MTDELAVRLQNDLTALHQFCQSFGLDPDKMNPGMLRIISRSVFPDTPISFLRDVFEELQLYDLVEFLEKVKPRILRPVLSLKEMKKLLNASERPTKFNSKAEVMIIEYSGKVAAVDPWLQKIGLFFQPLNSQNQVTKVTVAGQLEQDLGNLRSIKAMEERTERIEKNTETILRELLEKKLPRSLYYRSTRRSKMLDASNTNKQLLTEFYKEEQAMKKSLEEMIEKREERKLKMEKVEGKIKQQEEELQRELEEEEEKFQITVSTVLDKWNCQAKDEQG